jgi:hypothetical protein
MAFEAAVYWFSLISCFHRNKNHRIGDWVGPRVTLDMMGKRKILGLVGN